MTKFQREKQALTDVANKADEVADKAVTQGETLLGKLKASKYTAAGLLAAAGAVAFLLFK